MEIKIEELKTFSQKEIEAINNLLIRLNPVSKELKKEDLKEIIEAPSNYLFVARDLNENKIVGMTTLVVYRIPFSKKAWVEDVVVDEKYRGKGIATKIIDVAVKKAKMENVASINLTSRPQREAANKLYERLGFKKRATNVYKLEF